MFNNLRPHGRSPPGSSVMEFSRQEHWSGWSFPSSGDLPDPSFKPRSPALQVNSLLSESPGKSEWIWRSVPLVLTLLIDCARTVFGMPGDSVTREGVGLPRWLSSKESACQWRRHGLDPWVGKRLWRRIWWTTLYSSLENTWTEEPGGMWGMGSQRVRQNWVTERARLYIGCYHLSVIFPLLIISSAFAGHFKIAVCW